MRRVRYRVALNEALGEELERDERVFLIGEDIQDPFGGSYKVTQGLSDRFGCERVLNTPIAEGGFVGVALGAALVGLRPVVEVMYLDFALLASDQIINQVAKITYMTAGQVKVPLVIRTQGGGYKSSAAQHGQSLEALFAHIPGLVVVMPATPSDAKGLLKSAIRLDDPVLFIEHKSLYLEAGTLPDGEHLVPIGKADVKRSGADVTIVTWAMGVKLSMEAAGELEMLGVDAEVVDLRTLVPLDLTAVIESVEKTGRLVIVHEAVRRGGYGAEIAASVAEKLYGRLQAPVRRVTAHDVPLPMAPNLERVVLPQVEDVVSAVRHTVEARSLV